MKKSAAIKITIPQPCHESWDGMTPVQGGKHCEACSKVVTDFTVMTDRELVDYFKKYGGGGCGRFGKGQLERAILPPAELRHAWWMKIGIAAMVFIGLAESSRAQNSKNNSSQHTTSQQTPQPSLKRVLLIDARRHSQNHIDSSAEQIDIMGQTVASPASVVSLGSNVHVSRGSISTRPAPTVDGISGGIAVDKPTRWQRFKRSIRTFIHPTNK